MINIGVPDLVIVEKMNIKVVERLYAYVKEKDYDYRPQSYFFSINIKRFSANDVYSIYGKYNGNLNLDPWKHGFYGHSLVNIINNKIKLQKHFILGERDYDLREGRLLFHHSEVNEKFRKTNYLFSYLRSSDNYERHGNDRFINGKSLFKKIISFASFLNFKDIFKTYKIKAGHLVEMSFVKDIYINDFAKHFIKKYAAKNGISKPTFSINILERIKHISSIISHSKFFIKFKNLDLLTHNFELATVYWKPNDKTDVFSSDFKFKNNSYIQIGSKKYKLVFEESKDLDKLKKEMNKGETIEVGKLLMPEFTSYDFKKNKVINKNDEFSSRGILLPFNFKGDFFYKMHIGINEVFKDIDFFVYQKVNQKTLDPYEGKIKIKITSNTTSFDSKVKHKIFIIDSTSFKRIIDLGEFINPLAITRLSNKKDEEII